MLLFACYREASHSMAKVLLSNKACNHNVFECVFILWKETLEGSKTETSPTVILLLPPHERVRS